MQGFDKTYINRIGGQKEKVNTERKWTNERRKEKTDQRHHGRFKVSGQGEFDPPERQRKSFETKRRTGTTGREREEELAKKKDDEKDADFRKTIQKNGWENYEMETEDLFIRLPKRVREIREEGNNQHHCVATYIDRMVSGKTCILFIRKKNEPEKSYYTAEVREQEVIQVRGKCNKNPGEDVEKFMEMFKRRINTVMRKAG